MLNLPNSFSLFSNDNTAWDNLSDDELIAAWSDIKSIPMSPGNTELIKAIHLKFSVRILGIMNAKMESGAMSLSPKPSRK